MLTNEELKALFAKVQAGEATRQELVDALVGRFQAARDARAANPTDPGLPDIKEKVIIKKYDHTPLPGEKLDALETVIIEDGQVTVLPGNGED